MSADDIKLWLAIGGAVLTLASLIGGWALWSLRQAMVPRHEFAEFKDGHGRDHEELEEQLQDGRERFTQVEAMIKALPTRDEVIHLRLDMERLNGSIQTVSATLQAVKGPLDTIVNKSVEDMMGERP